MKNKLSNLKLVSHIVKTKSVKTIGQYNINSNIFSIGDSKIEILENSPYAEGRNSIYDTYVPKEFRRKGIASLMIKEVQSKYNNLSAQVGNEDSLRLYYKNGFRPLEDFKMSLDETIKLFKKDGSINMNWVKEGILPRYDNEIQSDLKNIFIKYTDDLEVLRLWEFQDHIKLDMIVVKNQGKGIGSKILNDLIKYADLKNKQIRLTPEKMKNTSLSKLKDFYKKFGFIENKGRNRDFRFSERMYRFNI